MIFIDPKVTDLAGGYEVIQRFITTMRAEWLPAFERSYTRRSEEYREAVEKYENRGLFLRTLLRKPKQPRRIPVRYGAEVEARLKDDWTDSFRMAQGTAVNIAAERFQETLDDHFFALTELQLQDKLAGPLLIIGLPGIIIVEEVENGLTNQPAQLPPEQLLQQTAIAVRALLQTSDYADVPIHAGGPQYWLQNLQEISAQIELDAPSVFKLIDILLARHQELSHERTFSALSKAEKLSEREKYNLLKMAATL